MSTVVIKGSPREREGTRSEIACPVSRNNTPLAGLTSKRNLIGPLSFTARKKPGRKRGRGRESSRSSSCLTTRVTLTNVNNMFPVVLEREEEQAR